MNSEREETSDLAVSSSVGQPIVVFGGFLTFPAMFGRMQAAVAQYSGQPVFLVQAWTHDWLGSVSAAGWARLLDKVDRAVQKALARSDTGKVTLVGHSSGGVVSRLYLSPEQFEGRAYAGLRVVDHLITLGSPHYSRPMREARMRRWVEERYPGAYFAPQVQYTSVGGQLVRGDRRGGFWGRWAYRAYEGLTGDGDAWGDGLVPLSSTFLEGSRHITLEGVAHFGGFGAPWYGTPEVIPRWWNVLSA